MSGWIVGMDIIPSISKLLLEILADLKSMTSAGV